MSLNSFGDDKKAGNCGEIIVYSWLMKQPKIKNVMDVSDDVEFQKQDIDFLVQLFDKSICKVEVKTDFQAHNTGNIPYEIVSTEFLNSKGCLEKTKADKVFYYIYNTNDLLIADVRKLRNYVSDNKEKLRVYKMGDDAKGYLLSITDLINQKIITKYERII